MYTYRPRNAMAPSHHRAIRASIACPSCLIMRRPCTISDRILIADRKLTNAADRKLTNAEKPAQRLHAQSNLSNLHAQNNLHTPTHAEQITHQNTQGGLHTSDTRRTAYTHSLHTQGSLKAYTRRATYAHTHKPTHAEQPTHNLHTQNIKLCIAASTVPAEEGLRQLPPWVPLPLGKGIHAQSTTRSHVNDREGDYPLGCFACNELSSIRNPL